jgi:HPr kinase/phosphorylase
MSTVERSRKTVPEVTVGHFYEEHRRQLHLSLLAGKAGLSRRIREGSVNRPGLALAGYFKYFARHRVQVIGAAENSYIHWLPPEESRRRLSALFEKEIPCLILARNLEPLPIVLEEAEAHSIAVFRSPLQTMRLINAITICLEMDFAPQVLEQGSMVDIQGVGVLIKGSSGVGKSECVLSLVERGHTLVSDDVTLIRCLEGRELVATAPEETRFHMEVRGIGIINVASVFGVRGIRLEKRLDLVVTLQQWDESLEIDRVGLDQGYCEILKIRVPHVTLPVRPGRNLATLVEVAALDQKLRAMGYHAAMEFNERLKSVMRRRKH